jgi:DNA-directed RNA polymerase specialized sigma24 family protein
MVYPESRRVAFDPTEFVAALAEGGARAEHAGRLLIRCYRPLLRARFFSKGVAAQDIDDLIADVLTSIVANAGQVREPSRFDAWVYAIASNVLNQHWTSKGRARDMLQPPASADGHADGAVDEPENVLDQVVDEGLSDPATALCLQGQLEAFRDKHPHRHACIELLVLGYDAREIAAQLGRTYGATRQFISQCCAVVMQFLSPCLEAAQLLGRGRGRAEAE